MLLFGGRTPEGRANDTWVATAPSAATARGCGGASPRPRARRPPRAASIWSPPSRVPPTVDRRAPTMAALFGGLDAGRSPPCRPSPLHVRSTPAAVRPARQASAFAPSPRAPRRSSPALVGPPARTSRWTRRAPRRLRRLVGAGRDGRQSAPLRHAHRRPPTAPRRRRGCQGHGAATTIEEEEAAAREEAHTAEQPSKKAKRVDEHGAAARPIDGAPPAVLPPTSTTTTTTTAAAAAAAPVVFDFATMAATAAAVVVAVAMASLRCRCGCERALDVRERFGHECTRAMS